jgi:hypothetical protein
METKISLPLHGGLTLAVAVNEVAEELREAFPDLHGQFDRSSPGSKWFAVRLMKVSRNNGP